MKKRLSLANKKAHPSGFFFAIGPSIYLALSKVRVIPKRIRELSCWPAIRGHAVSR
jgi:hypothetical protein